MSARRRNQAQGSGSGSGVPQICEERARQDTGFVSHSVSATIGAQPSPVHEQETVAAIRSCPARFAARPTP